MEIPSWLIGVLAGCVVVSILAAFIAGRAPKTIGGHPVKDTPPGGSDEKKEGEYHPPSLGWLAWVLLPLIALAAVFLAYEKGGYPLASFILAVVIVMAILILVIRRAFAPHGAEGKEDAETTAHHGFPWRTFFFYLPIVLALIFLIFAYTVFVGPESMKKDFSWFDHLDLTMKDRPALTVLFAGLGIMLLAFWFAINTAQGWRVGEQKIKAGGDHAHEEGAHHSSGGSFFPSLGTLIVRVLQLAVTLAIIGGVIYLVLNWGQVFDRFQNPPASSEYQTPKGAATTECTGMFELWKATTKPAKPGLGNNCNMAAKAKVPHTVAFIADNGKSYWSPGDVPDGHKVLFWRSKTGRTEYVHAVFCPPHSHWKGETLGCR